MKREQKSNYCEYCGDFHDAMHEYTSSVRIGETVPDYEFEALQSDEIKTMKFSDFRGKWLIVMFYPADFSFVCPTEFEEMANAYPLIKKLGAEVLTFSTDTVYAHKTWHDTSETIKRVEFPMGADPSGKISYAFGVLIEGDELPFTSEEGQALRGTFLVDPTGTLRTMEIHETSIGRSAKETLRKLQAAQYIDSKPGNVCPAAWTPGDDSMEPDLSLVDKL